MDDAQRFQAKPLPVHRLLILTDATQAHRGLSRQLQLAAAGGGFSLVLREKRLPSATRRALAEELISSLPNVELIVADPDWPTSACHLSSKRPIPHPRPHLVGRSSHRGDAPPTGVDYVTYSPVYASRSKPGYPPTGEAELADACARSPVPVYALGGIESQLHAAAARRCGAHGVAVMGSVMRADEPAELVERLLAAVG